MARSWIVAGAMLTLAACAPQGARAPAGIEQPYLTSEPPPPPPLPPPPPPAPNGDHPLPTANGSEPRNGSASAPAASGARPRPRTSGGDRQPAAADARGGREALITAALPPVFAQRPNGPALDSAVSDPACSPTDLDCNRALPGRGGFADPDMMWVGEEDVLMFVVALDDGGIARELGPGRQASAVEDIDVGRCMRVTLESHPSFEILSRNGETRRLSRRMGRASWSWAVMPRRTGTFDARARVEVLKRAGDACAADAYDEYTERVSVQIRIGFWRRFLGALREAESAGDVVSAVFTSWQTAVVSLTALLTAITALLAAVRALGKNGRRKRARRKAL